MHHSSPNVNIRSKSVWTVIAVCSVVLITLSSCDHTFAGTFFMFGFRDIVRYVGFVLFFGILAGVLGGENWRTRFWIGFLLGLVLTPVAGLIYCLILLTRK